MTVTRSTISGDAINSEASEVITPEGDLQAPRQTIADDQNGKIDDLRCLRREAVAVVVVTVVAILDLLVADPTTFNRGMTPVRGTEETHLQATGADTEEETIEITGETTVQIAEVEEDTINLSPKDPGEMKWATTVEAATLDI